MLSVNRSLLYLYETTSIVTRTKICNIVKLKHVVSSYYFLFAP